MITENLMELVTPDILPAAVAELRALGLSEANLRIAIAGREAGWYRLLDEEEHDAAFGIIRGVEIGVPAGETA